MPVRYIIVGMLPLEGGPKTLNHLSQIHRFDSKWIVIYYHKLDDTNH
jgi:hypothetical protein